MSQRLSRVVFATPVQDPSAPGMFERKDFHKTTKATMERAPDGTITLTAPDGSQVIASGIPYWCNPARDEPVVEVPVVALPVVALPVVALPVVEVPVVALPVVALPVVEVPPVTQTQAHPRDRIYRGKRNT